MEEIAKLLAVLILPIYEFFVPESRTYWLYILSAYAIGLFAYLRFRHEWSAKAVLDGLRQLFPRRILTHRSAIADYKMLFINNFTYFFLFPFLVVSSAFIATGMLELLRGLIGVDGLNWTVSWQSRLALTLFWLVAWDAGFFVAHYLQHKVPLLWEFHKVHHSAQVMTPLTVFRMHPVDDILTVSSVGFFTGLVIGLFDFAFGDPVTFYMVNGLNIVWFLFLLAGYHLRHSHIWIMYPKGVRKVISSPALHLIHHSDNPKHFDKNFARMFLFWDRLAGTLYLPEQKEEVEFGLGGGEHLEYDSLWKLYFLPFKKVAARYLATA